MESQITCIVGKLEALKTSRSVENAIEYAYMRFLLLPSNDVRIIEGILSGNLINSYVKPELEGEFYFVKFYNQIYLIGLKVNSRHVLDRKFFLSVASEINQRLGVEEYGEERRILAVLRLIAIVLGSPFLLAGLLLPPTLIITIPVGFFIKSCLDKREKRISEREEKDLKKITQDTEDVLVEIERCMQ